MNIQDRIIPVPQRCIFLEGEGILLKNRKYMLSCECKEKAVLVQRACSRLVAALEGKMVSACGVDDAVLIRLSIGTPEAPIPNSDQGYCLRIEGDCINITGYGELGLFYGVTTLLRLMQEDFLPALEVLDYPALKTRGHFIETRYGTDTMELEDWKSVVDFMVDHKENQLTVSVYGCWQVQLDDRVSEYVFVPFEGYPDLKTPVIQKFFSAKENRWVEKVTQTPMYEKNFLGELMAYGRENGVQVVPMMNSLGHNTLIPRLYPEVSAKDEAGEPSFTGFCTSNPKTYDLLFDLYDQIIDRYCAPNGVEAFDIGLDEVRDGKAYLPGDVGNNRSPWCKCPKCAQKTHGQLVIDHAIKLMSHLKEKGMKTVYMYNDMVVDHVSNNAAGTLEDRTEQFCEELKKHDLLDVACLDWWSYRELREMFQFQTIHPELGLRSTMKPWNGYYNWAFLLNAVRNNYHISQLANEENAEGMRSYSTWDESYHRNCQIQADYAWNHTGTGKPHTASSRYVRRHFAGAQGEANAAFLLMDDIARWRNRKDSKSAESSRYEIFFNNLCFYEYTYYRAGKEYPRNYPGEMIPKLRQEQAFLEELELMRDLSEQAAKLFAIVSETPGCDRKLARRYQYEAEHYGVLCDDFLVLAEMDKLAQQYHKTGEPALLTKIVNAARKQKEARKAHIADLEEIKEPYLIPSHSRIQSVPMQYFEDVEAYLRNTPVDRLKLDFADMRHAASQRFMNLR